MPFDHGAVGAHRIQLDIAGKLPRIVVVAPAIVRGVDAASELPTLLRARRRVPFRPDISDMRRDAVEALARVAIAEVVDDLRRIERIAGDHAQILGQISSDVDLDSSTGDRARGAAEVGVDGIRLQNVFLGDIEQGDARRHPPIEPDLLDPRLPLQGFFWRVYGSAARHAIIRAERPDIAAEYRCVVRELEQDADARREFRLIGTMIQRIGGASGEAGRVRLSIDARIIDLGFVPTAAEQDVNAIVPERNLVLSIDAEVSLAGSKQRISPSRIGEIMQIAAQIAIGRRIDVEQQRRRPAASIPNELS